MIPVKNPDESIAQYVQKMNDATSLHVDSTVTAATVGWLTILRHAVGTFLHVFIMKGYFGKGINGFIDARLASIYSLTANIKQWEYQMRQREGGIVTPPASESDIEMMRKKYSA